MNPIFKIIISCLIGLSVAGCSMVSRSSKSEGSDSSGFDDSDSGGAADEMDSELDSEVDKEPTKDTPSSGSIFGGSSFNAELKRMGEAIRAKNDRAVIKEATAILGKDSENLDALNGLAVHYFLQKKYGLAKIVLARAMKKHPKEPALHNNMGIIYLAEGDMPAAINSFRESLSESSSYRIGGTNLSSIYLDNRDYKRALAPLEESYDRTSSDLRRGDATAVEIANNYGVALMGVGDGSKAESVFDKITSSTTRNPVPFLNYAILLVEVQKKKSDAIRVISKLKFMTEDREILRRAQGLESQLSALK